MSLNIGNKGIIIFKQVSFLISARLFFFFFNETTAEFLAFIVHSHQHSILCSLQAWAHTTDLRW